MNHLPPQRAAALLIAVLVMLLGVGVWRARSSVETRAAPVAPTPHEVATRPELSSAAQPVAPSVPSTADMPAPAQRDGEVDVCGGRWARLTPDGRVDAAELERVGALADARTALLAALRADASEFSQAAALWYAAFNGDAVRLATTLADECQSEECAAARRDAAPALAAGRDALARLAAASRDPRVYALALHSCGTGPADGACRQLNVAQWARLDPGNAAPWLSLLERGDAAGRAEALHRIAQSTHVEYHAGALQALLLARFAPADASALLARHSVAAYEPFLQIAAWPMPGYRTLLQQSCTASAVRDANRRQECEAIAELLVARSAALVDRGVGTRLGANLGWPAERVERLRGEVAGVASAAHTGDDYVRAGRAAQVAANAAAASAVSVARGPASLPR